MNKLFFITLLFFLSLQKAINAYLCIQSIRNMRLENLSISHILKKSTHEHEHLGLWIHFFFSHFEHHEDLLKFLDGFSLNELDQGNRSCFKKGLTIFLLHYFANELKIASDNGNHVNRYEDMFINCRDVAVDFIEAIKIPHIISLLDTIINKDPEKITLQRIVSPMKRCIHVDNKDKPYVVMSDFDTLLNTDEDTFRRRYLSFQNRRYSNFESRSVQDFNVLGLLSLKSPYYNSDLSRYVEGVFHTFKTSRRLGLKRRSQQYDLTIYGTNSRPFGYCRKNNHYYHGSIDDLSYFFFSAMKAKMIRGHIKFLSDYKMAIKNKTYKMSGLKGFRLIKQLFSIKNFNNFIKLYIGHVSTELSFLGRDFSQLFDITLDCQVNNYMNRAGQLYYSMKQKK
ncbi:rhoptry-associated protein 2/3, putative [Plasmodium relictum]|uniref:Rhoptry-associated protein 2/3, putative n=1 Tax=Plasmodium relictum TaxID=85471 RepID=A0A1J1H7X2_PLARL|nr:rhoptry-associated protein 2/3, putative [Plasmodium relictum]CRH00653.1 rhoptry-associated protein 2/3, putative [Plasmodium relictum]